jgi:hypothetical protein
MRFDAVVDGHRAGMKVTLSSALLLARESEKECVREVVQMSKLRPGALF